MSTQNMLFNVETVEQIRWVFSDNEGIILLISPKKTYVVGTH